ncbi:MAG: DUF4836 family protein [Bacteroidetes bacterium]|nr:DUF4836 family protein [Bacteroidota bacterium]
MHYLRYTLLSLIFLGAAGALAGYFFFRRTVPVQARFIPHDAVLVLTADVRELALNAKGGKPLLPERGGDAVNKQLAALSHVLEEHGGGGIAQTADVQLFLFRRNESAWAGAALELHDSAAFGNMLRSNDLKREIMLSPAGSNLFALDSSGMVLGWNGDAALLLYPVGNHETAATVKMLAQLLALDEGKSIASNKAFCNAVLQEFDLSLWINPAEAISFTQSAPLAALFGTIAQLHLAADFSDGELSVKRYITENNYVNAGKSQPCPPGETSAYWYFSTSALYKHPAADLFFDDNELNKELAAQLTGQCAVFLHDTAGYTTSYTETVMDENFNTVQREVSRHATEFGHTCVYNLKKGADINALFARAAQSDSNIVQQHKALRIATGNLARTAFLQDGFLIVSTTLSGPYSAKKINAEQRFAAEINTTQILRLLPAVHADWPPQWLSVAALFGKHIQHATLSKPVFKSTNNYSDEFTIHFAANDINAMLQLRDLLREAAWLMQQKN